MQWVVRVGALLVVAFGAFGAPVAHAKEPRPGCIKMDSGHGFDIAAAVLAGYERVSDPDGGFTDWLCPPRRTPPVTQQQSRPTRSVPAQPLPTNALFSPQLTVMAGSNRTSSDLFPLFYTSLGAPDVTDMTRRTASDSSFVGGGGIGMNFASLPNPFNTSGSARPNSNILVGADFFVMSSGPTTTFQGSSVVGLGSGPASDTTVIRNRAILGLDGKLTIPVTASVNLVGHGGYAWVNRTVTYNCNGFCTDAAGIAARSSSTDYWAGGPSAGGGLQFAIPGVPVVVGIDYTRIFVGDRTFALGDPAAVQSGFRLNQDVETVTARATVPFSAVNEGITSVMFRQQRAWGGD